MATYLIRWRWGVLGVLAGLTIGALWGIQRLTLDPSNQGLFLPDSQESQVYQQFVTTFGSDEVILVALYDPQQSLLMPPGLAAVRQLTRALADVPHVATVQSLSNAPDMARLHMTPFGLAVPPLLPAGGLTEAQRQAIQDNPHVIGTLLSADLHTAGVLVVPDETSSETEAREAWIAAVRAVAAQHARQGRQTYVAGTPIERSDVTHYLDRDQRLITPLVLLVLMGAIVAIYRIKRFAVLVLLCVLLPMLWTMGLAGWSGTPLNAVTSLLPAVVLVVSVSLVIHLLNQFLSEIAAGASSTTAVERAVQRVLSPCFFAALTTAIGFMSLLISPIPAVQAFGFFAGVGVLCAFGATMTFGAIALLGIRHLAPARVQRLHAGWPTQALERLTDWVARHRRRVFIGVALVVGVALPGIGRIQQGTDIIRALKPTAPLRVSSEFIDQHLTGVNSLEVLITLDRGPGPVTPAAIRQVLAFSHWLHMQPDVTAVLSPWELLRAAPADLVAQDDQLTVLATLLPLSFPLQAWLGNTGKTVRVSARVRATDSERVLLLAAHIRQAAADMALSVQVTGRTYLLARMSRTLVRSQVSSLLLAALAIFASIVLMLRSWKMGLIAAVPNALPPLLIFGLMGWSGIELSTATTMIASVALGLLVDDTIHLLYRYHHEKHAGHPPRLALAVAIRHIGRAIIFTTVILTLGFWVGLLGSFKPTLYFSFLTGLTLLFALLAVLLVVPALLLTWETRAVRP